MQAKKIQNRSFWEKIPIKGFLTAALALNLFTVLLFLFLNKFLPPIVPLLYGRPSGVGQLLPLPGLLVAPAFSVCFIIINIFLSSLTNDLFAKKLLIITTFLLSLLTSITIFRIIFLIGFF